MCSDLGEMREADRHAELEAIVYSGPIQVIDQFVLIIALTCNCLLKICISVK